MYDDEGFYNTLVVLMFKGGGKCVCCVCVCVGVCVCHGGKGGGGNGCFNLTLCMALNSFT